MSLESEPSLSVGTQWDVMKDMTENLPIDPRDYTGEEFIGTKLD